MTGLAPGLQAIFETNQDDFGRRVERLEEAVRAISAGTLDEELRAAAERDAHNLVGSLGMFGLQRGSQLARELELRLGRSHEPTATGDAHLTEVVTALRGQVGGHHAERREAGSETGLSAQIQIVVVEDHPLVRQGLELLLPRHGFRMIGSAGCAREGGRMIRARKPDVALVDIDLGDGSGIDLIRAVADDAPATAIVLYTGSINRDLIDEAVDSGARALVLKTSPIERVADAIRAAAAGRNYVDTSVARMPARSAGHGQRMISAREGEVLGLLARGRTTQQIAGALFLSPETVQTHVRNATRKLGARGRLHAVILALTNGDIAQPDERLSPAADDASAAPR